MKALALADAVTAFTQSDFGRTFTPNNSSGTDHAWGNHHLVIGGAVQGGATYGSLPDAGAGRARRRRRRQLGAAGPLDARPARSTSTRPRCWRWFGASDAQLDAVLPNLRNFGSARTLGFL